MTNQSEPTHSNPPDLADVQGFSPLVGEVFAFDHGAGEADDSTTHLVLETVVEVAGSPGSPRRRPFALTFSGPGGDHLPQGVYDLAHPALGTIGIFLVPIGPGSDGRHRYEAVFN